MWTGSLSIKIATVESPIKDPPKYNKGLPKIRTNSVQRATKSVPSGLSWCKLTSEIRIAAN